MSRDEPTAGRVVRIRWWPAALIVGLALLAGILIWTASDLDRQSRVLNTILDAFVASILLLLWLLLGSRLPWRVRLLICGLVVAALVVFGGSLRIRGVSGDLVPILEWRWTPQSTSRIDTTIANPSGSAADRASVSTEPLDYPQFLGPRRNGTVEGIRLDPDWSAHPPRTLWRRPIGQGWSGFVVAGRTAVTQEQRGSEECVTAYRVTTGEALWAHCDRVRFEDPVGGPGPRATPTIHERTVYTLGATGILNVIELDSGRVVWSRDVLEENGASLPEYGVSASPLVFDDRVVVLAGGSEGRSLVAYDRSTGQPRWAGGDDPAAYSSPLLAELGGRRQVVVLNGRNLVGHDSEAGAVLWSFPWPGQTQRVAQPVVLPGSELFVSSGYGVGGKLLGIETDSAGGQNARERWESRGLKAKLSNVVHRNGYLFGLDDGILTCLALDSGERQWKGGRYGHGQIILVDDLLLIQAENGDVALVSAAADGFHELSRADALSDKTWNHPALSGSYLLVRNDRDAACLELPLRR